MRKLYHAFFYVSDEEKISEKVILTRMVTTVVIVVSCLLAMGITAYAYFSCGVASGTNTIKAAFFQAQIDITDEQGELVNPTAIQGASHIYSFQPGTYNVEMKIGNSTASTGFCIVRIDQTEYHTQQIGVDVSAVNQRRDCVAFVLNVGQSATVSIESHWGTSSYYDYISTDENPLYIQNQDPLKVIVVGSADNGTDEPKQEQPEETDENVIPDEVVCIAQKGESLALFAQMYGTTVERLAAYNSISDPRVIQIGQQIRIPPHDWVMPESNKEQNTTTLPETTPPSTEATGTSEPISTTEPSTTTTEPTTAQPTETTTTESTEFQVTEETQSATETTETTDTPTTEASE